MHAKIRAFLYLALLAAGVVQFALDNSSANLATTAFACAGAGGLFWYAFRERRFQEQPISALALFLYGLFVLAMPVLVSSFVEFRPVDANLKQPVLVFWNSFAIAVILVVSHWVYRRTRTLLRIRTGITKGLIRLRAFNQPAESQLWLMGAAGLAVWLAGSASSAQSGSGAQGGGISSIGAQLKFLAFLPLATPFMSQLGGRALSGGWTRTVILVLYTSLLVGASVTSGSRSSMVEPFACIAVIVMIWLFRDGARIKGREGKRFLLATVLVVAIVPAFERLATAIVAVRYQVGHVTPFQLAARTIDALSDPALMSANGFQARGNGSDYGDFYYDSELLTRVYNPKWSDNSLGMASRLTEPDRIRVRQFALLQPALVLPTPVLSILGLHVDKDYWTSFSVGDYVRYLATGYQLGGHSTITYTADVIWTGDGFLVVVGLFFLISYPLLDAFFCRTELRFGRYRGRSLLEFSPLLAANGYFFATYCFGLQSLAGFALIFRNIGQLVIVYWIMYGVSALALRYLGGAELTPASAAVKPLGRPSQSTEALHQIS